MLLPPLLSAWDPITESEGSIDPLSLSPIYDRLADRILPAITVRMRRIRFVTAMCAAAHVCSRGHEPDAVATDGVTPPWLVFEWFVVESLVRSHAGAEDSLRIPGVAKVRSAIRQGRPISNSSYLKTPKVFGYSGIFRRLCTTARILTADHLLDDGGFAILRAWERDVGLRGFLDGSDSTPGGRFREELRHVVVSGMKQGSTAGRKPDWKALAQAFDPASIRANERKALSQELTHGTKTGHAPELIQALQKAGQPLERIDEPKLLRRLVKSASADLANNLRAILAYEALCRPLQDVFDLLRVLSTERDLRAIGAKELAQDQLSARLLPRITEGIRAVATDDHLGTWYPEALQLAHQFAEIRTAEDLFRTVLQRHEYAQAEKPPDGKRPWFERVRGSLAAVRVAYATKERPNDEGGFVHEYRLPTLSRMLAELGAFP